MKPAGCAIGGILAWQVEQHAAIERSVGAIADANQTAIHEVGTAHMGNSAKDSVLNRLNQTWDVKNLFVMDGAAFTSGSHKNPTDTIMALSWRAAEFIVSEAKKGAL
ncbi:MAG: hypothetical protein IPG76_10905 [Acidobacteria bacterium]|nr:hypothetical protein [Acidobacteriota bacterium]MBK7601797.1 hypothetical protein [Acidobacteriota bacterium]